MKPPRPSYPRINCAAPGCKRGSTTFEPGTTMICGKCWRKAPKRMREWYSYWRRKALQLEKRGDPRAAVCWGRSDRHFHDILALLSDSDAASDDIPPLLAEDLRKHGLL